MEPQKNRSQGLFRIAVSSETTRESIREERYGRKMMKRREGKALPRLMNVIMSMTIAVALVLTGCGSSGQTGSADNSAEKEKTEKKVEKNVEITISAAGDCTLGRHTGSPYASSLDAYYDQNGASYFLKNVKSIFDEDDMTIVNFEGTLTDSTTPAVKQFTFKGPKEYLNILTDSGVDFMSFANNHMYDYKEQGCQDTIEVFEENDVPYSSLDTVGTYEVKGVKLGMVSVHGEVESEEVEMLENGIEKLKKQGADVIIANIHSGVEKANYPSDKQKNLAYCAVDAGADLVLEHHPHVIQGAEYYKGVYIEYSLGNFCFGGNRNPPDKDTIILQKTFRFKNGKLQRDDEMKIIPCSISSVSGYNNYQPKVLTGQDKERVIRRMNEYSAKLGVSFDSEGNATPKKDEADSKDSDSSSSSSNMSSKDSDSSGSSSSASSKDSDSSSISSNTSSKDSDISGSSSSASSKDSDSSGSSSSTSDKDSKGSSSSSTNSKDSKSSGSSSSTNSKDSKSSGSSSSTSSKGSNSSGSSSSTNSKDSKSSSSSSSTSSKDSDSSGSSSSTSSKDSDISGSSSSTSSKDSKSSSSSNTSSKDSGSSSSNSSKNGKNSRNGSDNSNTKNNNSTNNTSKNNKTTSS